MAIDFKGIGEGFKDWKTTNLIIIAFVVLAVYFNEDVSKFFEDIRIEQKKHQSKRDFIDFTDKANAVNYNMERLRLALGADRVTLIRFHNGTMFKDGSHFEKYSITQTADNPYIKPMPEGSWKDMSLHQSSWYFSEVINNKARYLDVANVTDFSTRSSFEAYGVRSHVGVPLYHEGAFVGVMSVNWILSKPDVEKILDYFNMMVWDSDVLYNKLKAECQDIYDLNY
jgi:hypothetical protein